MSASTNYARLVEKAKAASRETSIPAIKKQQHKRHRVANKADGELHLTDLGNARRLVAKYDANLRYVAALGWLV